MLRKDFNIVLDKYLETNEISSEDYERLDSMQEAIIQEIKRSLARIKYKVENSTIDHITSINCNEIPF